MAPRSIPTRGLSPLWMIALFLSFSETVLGIAVMQTQGGIQIALTTFVVVFPTTVSALFFFILWKKNYVFYPPTEFHGETDVQAFVQAMQSRPPDTKTVSEVAIERVEAKLAHLSSSIDSAKNPREQAAAVLKEAVEAIRESVVRVDSRPLFGPEGRVWEESYVPNLPMGRFLDNLYFAMQPQGLPAYVYGTVWAIRVVETKELITAAGLKWANSNGKDEDDRPIKSLGIKGGATLEIVPLQTSGQGEPSVASATGLTRRVRSFRLPRQ